MKPLAVVWHAAAQRELLNLSWSRAANIDRAILDFAERRVGLVRRVESATGREFVLLAEGYEIRFSVDRSAATMVIWAVWRMRKPTR